MRVKCFRKKIHRIFNIPIQHGKPIRGVKLIPDNIGNFVDIANE